MKLPSAALERNEDGQWTSWEHKVQLQTQPKVVELLSTAAPTERLLLPLPWVQQQRSHLLWVEAEQEQLQRGAELCWHWAGKLLQIQLSSAYEAGQNQKFTFCVV